LKLYGHERPDQGQDLPVSSPRNPRDISYNTWFERAFHQYGFVDKALRWRCPGDPACTYCDVEAALQQWLRSAGALHLLAARHAAEREARERAELHRLLATYGVPPEFRRMALPAAGRSHRPRRDALQDPGNR
jgi:hypothetical protein